MNLHGKDIKIFAANANPKVAMQIARHLGLPMGKSEVSHFSDGEVAVSIGESVRGSDVFVVQSTCRPVNDNITTAGADRVLTMDLHAPQIQGFFDIPVDHLLGVPLLVPYFGSRFRGGKNNVVIVSPDLGSVARARKFAERFDAPLAIVDKRRPKANVCEIMNIIGDVKDKKVILVDDMIDTAGTLCSAANAIMETGGAQEVYACATHGVLSGPALERIQESCIRELVLLDTIPIAPEKMIDKITMLSVAPVFAEAIERIYEDKPVSPLFV